MIKVTPVILCGGSGTRLWPLSRAGFPKQFLALTGNESLFQQATLRLMHLGSDDIEVLKPTIVSGEEHRFIIAEQLREVGVEAGTAILEPSARNTAPALTLAALEAQALGQDPVLVVTPADQSISEASEFKQSLQQAIRIANNGDIVILGVQPDRPETGYGYIQATCAVSLTGLTVHRFTEKPSSVIAQQYLTEGGYYWNAGIFVLRASVWLRALNTFRTDIFEAATLAWNQRTRDNLSSIPFFRPDKSNFLAIPSESIDYAVIEHCPNSAFNITMVPLDAG